MAYERICIDKLFVTRQAAVDTFARNVKRSLNNLIIQTVVKKLVIIILVIKILIKKIIIQRLKTKVLDLI